MQYILKHCPQNPTLEYAESIEIPKGTTEIISQGGGSTIDVGKWLAYKYNLPHTAIPTTAGTGSEVTRYCVLMTNGKKKTYNLKKPDAYILDPNLVITLPEIYTISSGLDALSQCFESLWSKKRTKESIVYSKMGIRLILSNLHKCLKDPQNREYRMNMMIGANFSGRAIEITQTNVCHAISYPLTEKYGIPHGIACAITLPYFAEKFLGVKLKYVKKILPKYQIKDIDDIVSTVLKSPKLNDLSTQINAIDIRNSLIL